MGVSSLLDLPLELRLHIYACVYTDEEVWMDPCAYSSAPQYRKHTRQSGSALLRACRQTRAEALPIYYSNVRVCFDVCRSIPPVSLINWLDEVGDQSAKLIRHFRLRWNNYVDIVLDLRRLSTPHSTNTECNSRNTGHIPSRPLSSGCSDGQTRQVAQSPYAQNASQDTLVNPTKSVRTGDDYVLSVEGLPSCDSEYWDQMGTVDFCSTMAWVISQRLQEVLDRPELHMTKQDLMDFVADADDHGSGLRWLWYW